MRPEPKTKRESGKAETAAAVTQTTRKRKQRISSANDLKVMHGIAKITKTAHARPGQESEREIADKTGTDLLRNSPWAIFVLTVFLLIPFFAPAATYYVAAVSGNDTNAGTSESAPWQTIAKLNARSFSPGDGVLFKRGCMWREQLTIRSAGAAGRPITFGAYGAGNLPDINGADLVSSWTGNGSNTWRAATTTQPNQVMFNGTLGTHVRSAAACNSDTKWYWASNVLYTYGTQNPDITSHDRIEASQRETCIDVENNYITIDGIGAEKSNSTWNGGIIVGGTSSNITVCNCETAWHYANGCYIYRTAGGDIKFLNNKVHDCGSGIQSWRHGGSTSGHEVLIRGNEVYHTRSVGGTVGNAIQIYGNYYIVENNYVHDNGDLAGDDIGIHIYTDPGLTAYGQNNIIRSNTISGQISNNKDGSGIETDYYAGTVGINRVCYNVIYGCHGPGIDIYGSSVNACHNITYGNSVNHAKNIPANSEILITNPGNVPGTVIRLENNVACATQPDSNAIQFDPYTVAHATLCVSNNDFYDAATAGSNWYSYNGTNGSDLAAFNSIANFTNNLNADPHIELPGLLQKPRSSRDR